MRADANIVALSRLLISGRMRTRALFHTHERADTRHDFLSPCAAMEQTKMTDSRLLVMLVSAGRHAGAERVRHAGLAEARDIIVGAFDGQQCSAAYGRRIHPCPAPMEQATRKRKFVEGERDHVEEQLPWNVHHSQEERKKWMGLQIRTIIRKRLPAQFPTRAEMARELC